MHYLRHEDVTSARCFLPFTHSSAFFSFPSPVTKMSLTMVYFLNSLHSGRNIERLSSHSKIKISGHEKQAKPLFIIDFPLILHDLPYCHFKTGFCKTLGVLFNTIIILPCIYKSIVMRDVWTAFWSCISCQRRQNLETVNIQTVCILLNAQKLFEWGWHKMLGCIKPKMQLFSVSS